MMALNVGAEGLLIHNVMPLSPREPYPATAGTVSNPGFSSLNTIPTIKKAIKLMALNVGAEGFEPPTPWV